MSLSLSEIPDRPASSATPPTAPADPSAVAIPASGSSNVSDQCHEGMAGTLQMGDAPNDASQSSRKHVADEESGSTSKRPRISAPQKDKTEDEKKNDSRTAKYQVIKNALSNNDERLAVRLSTEVIESESGSTTKWLQPFYLSRSKARLQLGEVQASLADAKLAIRADQSDPRGYLQAASCLKEAQLEKNCRAALAMAREKWGTAASSFSSTAIAKFNAVAKEIEGGLTPRGIARMPVEVLIRIFIACDGDVFTLTKLECVCRKWRQILRNAPDPWKQVHLWHPQETFLDTAIGVADIPAEPAPSLTCKSIRKALHHATVRSGKKVTSIQLDLRKGHIQDIVRKITELIDQNGGSIQNLKVCVPDSIPIKVIDFLKLPRLRSYLLADGYHGNSQGPSNPRVVPIDNIKIKHLVLLTPLNIYTSFTALRTLVIQGGAPHLGWTAKRLLKAIAPSKDTIQHLRIGTILGDHEATQTKLILPKLQSFEATAFRPIGPSPLCGLIKAPNLKLLSVVSVKHDEMASLFRDLCDITQLEQVSLSFAESPITSASRLDALNFVSQLQRVVKLDISAEGKTQIVDDIVTCLAPTQWVKESGNMSGCEPTFLPSLSTLIIRKHPNMTGSQLMRSVAARLPQELGSQGPSDISSGQPQSQARPVSSAFKRAAPVSKPSAAAAAITNSSSERAIQVSTSTCLPISTLILHQCPAMDPKAEEWLQAKVPTFAHVQPDRSARQRAEASARSIRPW
ncbi:hypothetical protein CF327_g588 [Tilletia walkeri]|nr:hypothetical protein CF327_g588 [Tilletia walkeri]